MCRLAQCLDLDPDSLLSEFMDHRAIALHEATAKKLSTLEAWISAVRRTSERQKAVRLRHPSDSLRSLLIRYACWTGATTSGVEQSFSQAAQFLTPSRNHMAPENEFAEIKVMSDFQQTDKDAISDAARHVWAEWFGTPRSSAADRIDTGVSRVRKPGTERHFLQTRREAVGADCEQVSVEQVAQEAEELVAEDIVGNQALLSEMEFQQSKQFKNRLLAFMDNALLESEISVDLLQMAQAYKDHKDKLSRDRARNEKRKFSLMSPGLPDLEGQPMWLEDADWQRFPSVANKHLVGDCMHVRVFVVKNPAHPGEQNAWLLALMGGHSIDLQFVKTAGAKGVCFTYDPAIAVQRKLYISEDFRAQNPEVTHWVTFSVESRRHQGMKCTALTTTESAALLGEKARNVFSLGTFFAFISQRVVTASRSFANSELTRSMP